MPSASALCLLALSLPALTTAAPPAAPLTALAEAERAAFLSDARAAGSLPPALALASVRRAERFRASLASGRLAAGPVAHTSYGDLVGVGGGNVSQWLGVPFAAPPTGPLRWRAPAPPAPWGTRNATWFGPTCPQTEANTWAIFTGTSEDCLNLNIYAPSAPPPAGGYPVMVFWYGGSFTYGSAGFPLYDGWFDVSLLESTVIVASNYRLGVLGFLAGDALRAEAPDGSVGTYGTLDQRAALVFVRDNIAAFGGDPSRVTIFGQSAGAASVANHLVSPGSRGLFARGIIESGAFSTWTAQPYNISSTRLAQFAANTGCAGGAGGGGAALLACLRALTAEQVLAGDKGLTSAFLEWSPTIDGVVIPDDPRVLLAAGAAADVPLIMGYNSDEGSMFVRAPKALNASGYTAAIAQILGPVQAPLVAAQYPCSAYQADLGQSACWWALAAVERDCSA
jgi:para-nitrobenzyl esterase